MLNALGENITTPTPIKYGGEKSTFIMKLMPENLGIPKEP